MNILRLAGDNSAKLDWFMTRDCAPPRRLTQRRSTPYPPCRRVYAGTQTGSLTMHKTAILTLAALLALPAMAQAKTVTLTGHFTTEGDAATHPSGLAVATLNTATDELTYSITYAGLSGPVLAAHFHGPAKMDDEAKVLLPIPGPYTSGMTRKAKITPKIAHDLLAGLTYVNLHTKADPMGEARAQMEVGQ
jgi:hypothetical protein